MGTTVNINQSFFEEIALSDEVRAAVVALAEQAKTEAETLSAEFAVTGHYASSFDVSTADITLLTRPGKRAAGILTNTADYSAAVEWGNANDHRPHRVLGRVLDTLNRG